MLRIQKPVKNISLFADVNIDKITVKDADLCSILSNLIDNAIEAVDKIENDKTVKLNINQKREYVVYCHGKSKCLQSTRK